MEYLVFSDSHGNYTDMIKIIEKRKPKGVIFLGDCVRDIDKVRSAMPFYEYKIVEGNNDFHTSYPTEEIFRIAGTNILLCHGHNQRVKYGNTYISYYCKEKNCDMAFFGHTHKPLCEYYNGVLLFNPGSIGGHSYKGMKTYGILSLEEGSGIKTSIQTITEEI